MMVSINSYDYLMVSAWDWEWAPVSVVPSASEWASWSAMLEILWASRWVEQWLAIWMDCAKDHELEIARVIGTDSWRE